MVTDQENARQREMYFNLGMSKGAKYDSIANVQENLAIKASAMAEFSGEGKGQFDYKQQSVIDYRARAQEDKAFKEGEERELGRQSGKKKADAMGGVQPYGYNRLR